MVKYGGRHRKNSVVNGAEGTKHSSEKRVSKKVSPFTSTKTIRPPTATATTTEISVPKAVRPPVQSSVSLGHQHDNSGNGKAKKKKTKKKKRGTKLDNSDNNVPTTSQSRRDVGGNIRSTTCTSTININIDNINCSIPSRQSGAPAKKRVKEKPARFAHPQLDAELRRLCRPWLSPGDPLFEPALTCSYRGMRHVPRDSLPRAVHTGFRRSFDALHEAGLFLYDTVQAGGKRLSRTFVTRTLIGDPGITYKVNIETNTNF